MSSPIQAGVVIKKLYHDGDSIIYSWRRRSAEGRWLNSAERGDINALQNALSINGGLEGEENACLLLPGTDVVCQSVTFSKQEKKHLARLIPYELEEELTDELDDLHFAYCNVGAESAVAAYTDAAILQEDIQALESLGLSVNHCLPEPVLLERLENGWSIRLDDYLHVHYGSGLGFSVERDLAATTLKSLALAQQPEHLLLLADDPQSLETLRKLIPLDLTQHLVEEQIDTKLCDEWDALNFSYIVELDLRQGTLARQLPIAKWWQEWRTVGVVAGFAIAAFVGLGVAEVQINNAKQRNIVEQISQTYRQVVPQGAMADPERQLRQKLSAYETTGGGGSFVAMLAKVAPIIATKESINLRNLRYDDQRGTMDITLTAKTYGDALDLSNKIQGEGLSAQLQNVNASGDEQQVRMIVARATQ